MGSLSQICPHDRSSHNMANTISPIPKSNTAAADSQQQKVNTAILSNTSPSKDSDIDVISAHGNFGWATIDNVNVPTLLRNQDTFVSVRIVEMQLLSQYPNTFPAELGEHSPLVSYRITHHEQKLLNEINIQHCSNLYGEALFKERDLIVKLEEFEEFYNLVKKTFPEEVMNSRTLGIALPPPAEIREQPFGWIQINHTLSPYIRHDRKKFVMLPVLKHAAGLLKDVDVPVLLPSVDECSKINRMCVDVGLDFQFSKSSNLVDIDIVREHHKVVTLELPLEKPLVHAQHDISLESLQAGDHCHSQPATDIGTNVDQLCLQSQQQPQQEHLKQSVPSAQQQTLQQQSMTPLPQQQACQHQSETLQQHSVALQPQQQTLQPHAMPQQPTPQHQSVPAQSHLQQSLLQQALPPSQQPLPQRQPPPYPKQPAILNNTRESKSSQSSSNQTSVKSYQIISQPAVATNIAVQTKKPPEHIPSLEQMPAIILKQTVMEPQVRHQLIPIMKLQYVIGGLPPGKSSSSQQPLSITPQYFLGMGRPRAPAIGAAPPNVCLDKNNPLNRSLSVIAHQRHLLPVSTAASTSANNFDLTPGSLQVSNLNASVQLNTRPPPYVVSTANTPNTRLDKFIYMGSPYQLSNQRSDTYPTNSVASVSDSVTSSISAPPSSSLGVANFSNLFDISNAKPTSATYSTISLTNVSKSVTTSISTAPSSTLFPRPHFLNTVNVKENQACNTYPINSRINLSKNINGLTNIINMLPTAASSKLSLFNDAHYRNVVKSTLSLNKLSHDASHIKNVPPSEMLDTDIFSPTQCLNEGDKAAALEAALARFERDAPTATTIMTTTNATVPSDNTSVSAASHVVASNTIPMVPGPLTSIMVQETTPHMQSVMIDLVGSTPQVLYDPPKIQTSDKALLDSGKPVSPQIPDINNDEVKRLACLVQCITMEKCHGKYISCLEHKGRKGKYSLLEAIGKVYFRDIDLNELQFCMGNVLNMPSVTCTPDEEKAFVRYYALPLPVLKCNKIVEMDTLDKHFQQLVYIFSKKDRRFNHIPNSAQFPLHSETSTNDENHRPCKRSSDGTNTSYESQAKVSLTENTLTPKPIQSNDTVIEIDC